VAPGLHRNILVESEARPKEKPRGGYHRRGKFVVLDAASRKVRCAAPDKHTRRTRPYKGRQMKSLRKEKAAEEPGGFSAITICDGLGSARLRRRAGRSCVINLAARQRAWEIGRLFLCEPSEPPFRDKRARPGEHGGFRTGSSGSAHLGDRGRGVHRSQAHSTVNCCPKELNQRIFA